ncbi:glycoside hydrolase family 32 protein [Diplodia corticola]|uniref:Glycoside hydrolase family 32 protein n=1 Tax=Diplodia corticola TaxID=236234 RepID=A0A1J9QYB8_9PEZI|nr:glycoside hydrolase family 32 protein [Diplodia corticola]OJD34046.1 glycoside hydrolase family 32 protein [Diplodia corticola]
MSSTVLIERITNCLAPAPKDEPEVTTTPEQDDYSRWRPSYHIIAPAGWMNDPCAPGYDPTTRQYHVGFQWNPDGAEWGDIVWGNSTSRDLVSWKVAPKPTVSRDTSYDHAGVFTGCFRPTAPNGAQDGTLTYIYTAVSKLPIHYTLPYNVGSEKLAIATSTDGGKTWSKPLGNPILNGPPRNVPVTGWRDPYVASWANMARALGGEHADGKLFATISGGLVGRTPTVFLYAVDASDLSKWEYLGPLMDVGLNKRPSHWSGDLGVNWEVTNFMTLTDGDGASQEFLILGAEGCKSVYRQEESKRTPRGQLWVAGNIRSREGQTTTNALVDYAYGGVFDHGLFYAANGFWDPETQQQVVIGWVTEDDLPVELQIKQQWSGCLSLPRIAGLMTLRHVRKARKSELKSITSIQTESDAHGTSTVRTMRISPDRRLQKLRRSAQQTDLPTASLGPLDGRTQVPLRSTRWELDGEFAVAQTCTRVGIAVFHSEDVECRTELYWSPAEEDFAVERPDLVGGQSAVKMQTEHAPHTLFTTRDVSTGAESEEKLRVQVFYDGSVLEVFVNERTAITTRVYTSDARCVGLALFAEGDAQVTGCSVWDGLSCA